MSLQIKQLAIFVSLSRCVGQDRNCHLKSCLLNCWSVIIDFKRYPSTYCLVQGSCYY